MAPARGEMCPSPLSDAPPPRPPAESLGTLLLKQLRGFKSCCSGAARAQPAEIKAMVTASGFLIVCSGDVTLS